MLKLWFDWNINAKHLIIYLTTLHLLIRANKKNFYKKLRPQNGVQYKYCTHHQEHLKICTKFVSFEEPNDEHVFLLDFKKLGNNNKKSVRDCKWMTVSCAKWGLSESTNSFFAKLWTSSLGYIWIWTLGPWSGRVLKEHCTYLHRINFSIASLANRIWNDVWVIS